MGGSEVGTRPGAGPVYTGEVDTRGRTRYESRSSNR